MLKKYSNESDFSNGLNQLNLLGFLPNLMNENISYRDFPFLAGAVK